MGEWRYRSVVLNLQYAYTQRVWENIIGNGGKHKKRVKIKHKNKVMKFTKFYNGRLMGKLSLDPPTTSHIIKD
jgi:hypothetical protein